MLDNTAKLQDIISALQEMRGLSVRDEFIEAINGIIAANNDYIKAGMLTELNGKLNLGLTAGKSWPEIKAAVNGWINPNKKWASGTVIGIAPAINFMLASGTTYPLAYVVVTGLDFKPSRVFLKGGTGTSGTEYVTMYDEFDTGVNGYPKSAKLAAFENSNLSVPTYKFKGDVNPAYVTNGGFKLPVHGAITYNWIAIE